MGDEFYSVIKLTTGEELFALVSVDENDGDPILILQNPVTMRMTRSSNGTMLRVKPWLEIPSDDFYVIRLDKIITMTEVKDEDMIEFYNNYLEDDSTDELSDMDNQAKLTNKMGYIGSVEEARESLEKLYKLKDNKES